MNITLCSVMLYEYNIMCSVIYYIDITLPGKHVVSIILLVTKVLH